MCGIAGLIDPDGGPVDAAILRRMTAMLTPRGPDAEGFWSAPGVGLGHRRLAVIDLSDAGRQPMTGCAEAEVQVVLNGEIYNFAQLRDELSARGHRFHSRSDTEVLVHGYEEWGDGVIDRADGMFAFAIWDGRARRLLAARDRMGKKPLYYAMVPRAGGAAPLFAFASELKALFTVPGLDRGVDPAALVRYLAMEHVPAPRSIVRGARKLDGGERLVLDVGRDGATAAPRIDRYWDLPFPPSHVPRREEDAVAELRLLLARAVKRRLVADVPLGVFLSGGIDSSAVAALMAAQGAHVKTFSIGFTDASFDETKYARLVAERLGTEHHEERLDPRALIDALPDVARFLDEPLGDSSIVPTYLLSRYTRQHVTVALGGDGGDELFAGYPTFKAERMARALYDHVPGGARTLARRLAERLPARTDYFSLDFMIHQFLRGADESGPRRHASWLGSFLPDEQAALLRPEVRAAASEASGGRGPLDDVDARAAATSARHPDDVLMDFYARFYLGGDVLVKVDRASGAVGLEVRAPLLDTDVVAFACALPPELRLRRMTTKYLLKRALEGMLPHEILHRKKQGFAMPVAAWFKGPLQPLLREELHPDKIRREGFFDPAAVTRIVDDHTAGRRDRRKQLWTLFVFERWLGTHGEARA